MKRTTKKIIMILGLSLGAQLSFAKADVELPYTLKGQKDCSMTVHALSFEGIVAQSGFQALHAKVSVDGKPGTVFEVDYERGFYKGTDPATGAHILIFGKQRRKGLPFQGAGYVVRGQEDGFAASCRGLGVKPRKPGKPAPPRRKR